MAYDINQLLDDLPALMMQHNRDKENKRQFDVKTNETKRQFDVGTTKVEEENMRNFGQRENDFAIRKDQADYQKQIQDSYSEIGKNFNSNRKRSKVHEEGAEDYLDRQHAKSWNSWFPRSWDEDDTETEELAKYWGDGAPQYIESNPQVYDQGIMEFQNRHNPNLGSKHDQLSLLKLLKSQGGY